MGYSVAAGENRMEYDAICAFKYSSTLSDFPYSLKERRSEEHLFSNFISTNYFCARAGQGKQQIEKIAYLVLVSRNSLVLAEEVLLSPFCLGYTSSPVLLLVNPLTYVSVSFPDDILS